MNQTDDNLELYKKHIHGYLLLNWKTGQIVAKKRKPKNIKGFEIPIEIDLTITPPKDQNYKVSGHIPLTVAKLGEIFVECL